MSCHLYITLMLKQCHDIASKKKKKKKKKKWRIASRYVYVRDVIYIYCLLHPEEAVMAKR